IPLLLFHERTGHAAAVHAGWRGVVAGVVRAGVEALDADRASIVAAIGPCIGVCCFEVGDDVAKTIVDAALGDASIVYQRREQSSTPGLPRDSRERGALHRDAPKPHVDLRRAVRLQLKA